MSRTYVVTGVASGIGRATAELLRSRGEHVIGVDLRDADLIADLSSKDGLASMVDGATDLSGGAIDGVLAIAGVLGSDAPLITRVNYFGAIGTLSGLRPLLARSAAPRAAAISSMASLLDVDQPLLDALTAEDEAAAIARAEQVATPDETDHRTYATTKRALAKWIRRSSVTDDWAGAGIPLNAIAPGVVRTPMSDSAIDEIVTRVPMPLVGPADPVVCARLLAWLTSEENTHVTGQVIFQDGGSDAVIRGDSTW